MLTGKKFRLTATTLGIEDVNGRRRAVPMPKGATINVLQSSSSSDPRMVDITWDGKILVIFEIDLRQRGEEIFVGKSEDPAHEHQVAFAMPNGS